MWEKTMPSSINSLLKDKKVKKEIERYKWLESEKKGYDIGPDNAARDWLELYGQAWIKEHVVPATRTEERPKRSSTTKKQTR